jgi:hypothetical protein
LQAFRFRLVTFNGALLLVNSVKVTAAFGETQIFKSYFYVVKKPI